MSAEQKTRRADPGNQPEVALTMFSQPRYLAAARGAVSAFARQAGFDEAACGHIALAVDEALCNVIRHGYNKREDGVIWIKCWPLLDSDQTVGVKIVIEDEARQVDPNDIKGRDLADVRPGGLGVHIIKEVMDRAQYEPRAEGGMRLTMERLLPSAGSKVRYGQCGCGPGSNGKRCGEQSA